MVVYDEDGNEIVLRDMFIPHDPVVASVGEHSMTRQEFAAECDINTIMKKYEVTGQLPQNMQGGEPVYFDTTTLPPDLMSAMAYLKSAEQAFMMLPAVVRREFDNDPVKFVDYGSNPANLEQMREWGLAPPAVAEKVVAPGLVEPPPVVAAIPPTKA